MTIFEMDVDIPDKSTKFSPHAIHYLSFPFLIGTTSCRHILAAILDFQDGRHLKTYIYHYVSF